MILRHPKTWEQLDKLAAKDRIRLFRTNYRTGIDGVTMYMSGGVIEVPVLTFSGGNHLEDEDNDRILRLMVAVALDDLRRMSERDENPWADGGQRGRR